MPVAEAKQIVDGLYLGPVSQGDVYRASRLKPDAIAIVDGYFARVPAVWHKEILWALSSGIHVFGSASMGALRAAELAPFGMVGVGEIFEAFRTGELEDDDEVALVHAAAEYAYRPLSEAMVNVRATLAQAERVGVLSRASRLVLERIMKNLHYADRLYVTMLDIAAERGVVPPHELTAFAAWLPTGEVNQKAADAIAMLHRLKDVLDSGERPPVAQFDFAYTSVFEELKRNSGVFEADDAGPAPVFGNAVLNEARLAPDWERYFWQGLARRLALQETERLGIDVDEQSLYDAIVEFRMRRDLLEPADLQRWLEENHVDRGEFVRLMEADAKIGIVLKMLQAGAQQEIIASLRLEGRYAALADRSARKRGILENVSTNPPSTEVYEAALARYGAAGLSCESAELGRLAAARGFESPDALLQAVLVEYLYAQAHLDGFDRAGSPKR